MLKEEKLSEIFIKHIQSIVSLMAVLVCQSVHYFGREKK